MLPCLVLNFHKKTVQQCITCVPLGNTCRGMLLIWCQTNIIMCLFIFIYFQRWITPHHSLLWEAVSSSLFSITASAALSFRRAASFSYVGMTTSVTSAILFIPSSRRSRECFGYKELKWRQQTEKLQGVYANHRAFSSIRAMFFKMAILTSLSQLGLQPVIFMIE